MSIEKYTKWFSHVERMGSGKFVNKVYKSELKVPTRRGRPLGRRKERVEEYLGKKGINGRGVLKDTCRECWDWKRWRLFCRGLPLGERGIRAIDR